MVAASISADNKVVFAIPLKPKVKSRNWANVERNLIATIKSIQGSTSDQYLIAIAGHDEPDLSSVADSRIHFLKAEFEPQLELKDANIDKNNKRAMVGAWAREHLSEACHFAFIDADDLVHKDLVAHVVQGAGRTGFVVDKGYRLDHHTLGLESINSDFCQRCGSCFVPLFRREELPTSWSDKAAPYCQYRGHQRYPAIAERMGMPIELITFRAIVYVINHDESLQVAKKGIRGIVSERTVQGEVVRQILASDYNYVLDDFV